MYDLLSIFVDFQNITFPCLSKMQRTSQPHIVQLKIIHISYNFSRLLPSFFSLLFLLTSPQFFYKFIYFSPFSQTPSTKIPLIRFPSRIYQPKSKKGYIYLKKEEKDKKIIICLAFGERERCDDIMNIFRKYDKMNHYKFKILLTKDLKYEQFGRQGPKDQRTLDKGRTLKVPAR